MGGKGYSLTDFAKSFKVEISGLFLYKEFCLDLTANFTSSILILFLFDRK